MTLYHGTTLKAAKAIRKNGLRPFPEKQFKLWDNFWGSFDDSPEEAANLIHLTPSRDIAEAYARYRATYERAAKGEMIIDPSENLSAYTKTSTKRDIKAQPAIVVIDGEGLNLNTDPYDYRGLECACAILPWAIRDVIPL